MIQTVVKRDGRIVGFNEEKIITAIRKAMLHTDKGEDMSLSSTRQFRREDWSRYHLRRALRSLLSLAILRIMMRTTRCR